MPQDRVFLVVVDDSPEKAVALRYACLRVRKSGGRVALLRITEPPEMQEWAGIAALMQEERRQEAEQLLSALAAEVEEMTGALPLQLIREGDPVEEVLEVLAEDPRISILVLATATEGGPGPLTTALTGRHAGALRCPITLVPGGMTDAELDRVT
ncbi:universal stress protein [Muricoccus pecuniae]|uniref:Nucleotide-binding universal stress UspA family protein n=1 Tax=Muricoccus pecuniae TaxID=693023 RepID=A0A840Y3A4_9PROT|nr:universal stress protein [Roseomonas pecuniae]MBB5694170.1 nucleotide-binding universal stress UspA family protein [Roseomonas pecuniae]